MLGGSAMLGRTAVAILASMQIGAASADPSAPDPGAWEAAPLVDFARLGVSYWHVDGDPEAVVTIDRGEITYSGPCDTASIPYERAPDGGLRTFPAGRLGPNCSAEHGDAFLRFYMAVRQSSEVRTWEGAATFGWGTQPMARLRRFEPAGLEFRRWQVAEFAVDGRMVEPDMSFREPGGAMGRLPPPSIVFEHGWLDGSPGCGGLLGKYRLEGASILISPHWVLAGMCSDSLERQNDVVLQDLAAARRIEADGRRMVLLDAAGQRLVVLTSA